MINFNFVASRPMKIESTCIEIIDRKKGKERSISIRKIGNNVFDIYIYTYINSCIVKWHLFEIARTLHRNSLYSFREDLHKIPYAIWLIILLIHRIRDTREERRVNLYAGYACKYEA